MQELFVPISSYHKLPDLALLFLLPRGCPCRHTVGYSHVLSWHAQPEGVYLIGVEQFVATAHEVTWRVQFGAILYGTHSYVEN